MLSKDVKALIKSAEDIGYNMRVLKAVGKVNDLQKHKVFDKFENYFNGDLIGRKVAIWGLSFKPETDDMREATALVTIDLLLKAGCKVKVFDPISMSECKRRVGDKVEYGRDIYDTVLDADAILLLTEWKQFLLPSWKVIYRSMNHHLIVDGRNIYDAEEILSAGFQYLCIGRK